MSETGPSSGAELIPEALGQQPKSVYATPELPVQWFDLMRLTRRKGEDIDVVMFSFAHIFPEPSGDLAGAEFAKVITSAAQTRKMIDAMCLAMDYFPIKPAEGAS